MLKLRLSRGGSKKRPYYHIVVADIRSPRDGRYIERVGSYNPKLPREAANRVLLKEERIKHWLERGAQPTDRVAKFLGHAGIIEMPTYNNPNKAKPKAKALERIKEKEEKAAAAAEAAKAAEEEVQAETTEAPAEDTAAEEAPAEEKAEA